MIISKEKYCIASKDFPLKFYIDGEEYQNIEDAYLMDKEWCEKELAQYDEPEELQIIKVQVTYEI